MKIINLKAENVKKITAIDITPVDNLVEITGPNGAGKTSILDAIWWALAGSSTHQSKPIRNGQRKATIQLDLGQVIVTREFERKPPPPGKKDEKITTKIKVETSDGARFPTPQKLLDSLIGSLSFDPLQFTHKDASEQYDTLKSLLGLDFKEDETANLLDYHKRTDLNREAKAARTTAAAITVDKNTPKESVDVKELMKKLTEIDEFNRVRNEEIHKFAQETQSYQVSVNRAEQAHQVVCELTEQLRIAKVTVKGLLKFSEEREKSLKSRPPIADAKDATPIREKIEDSERVNSNVASQQRKMAFTHQAHLAEKQAERCSAQIAFRTVAIQRSIEKADMPVSGLSLQDGLVTFEGLPLDQASDADQLRVSCAIAMRADHKLKVIRIRNGSLLDKNSMSILSKMAVENDYQVWIEIVDTSGKVGIVIEDGRVVTSHINEDG